MSFRVKKQKSFIPKKTFLGRCQYQNKKALITDPIFSEGFGITDVKSGWTTYYMTQNLAQSTIYIPAYYNLPYKITKTVLKIKIYISCHIGAIEIHG